jgi:hypothetical protein
MITRDEIVWAYTVLDNCGGIDKQEKSEAIKIFSAYIHQREKKDELLELYRVHYNKQPLNGSMYDLEVKIKELEGEIKMNKVKINLTPENKHEWEKIGWDLRASNINGIGTYDFSDNFVDDYFGSIIHENGMEIYERKDLNIDIQFRNLGLTNFHYEYNNETLFLIKLMFDKGLFYVKETEETK